MRTSADSVFLSSLLLTIALFCLIPAFWANVLTARDHIWLAKLDAGYRAAAGTMSDLSVVCLAMILVGLIVIWTGYLKRVRWAWAVMFVMVWVWAFPLLALTPFKALFEGRMALTLSEWLYSAIYQPGSPRIWAESVLIFLLMLIALLLPIKSFFFVRGLQEPSHRPSARFIGFSVMSVLVVMITLFAWIRVGAVYEIPPNQLLSWRQFPVPPPPPDPCKTERGAKRE